MASDFYGFEDDEPRAQGRDHLFLWTVFILLLVGLAFACWLGSFYVFGHPEQPRSYALLMKLKKLEKPKRFEVTQAPGGEFLTPQKLFERYSKYPQLQLKDVNDMLLRNYIKNYKEVKGLVPYVSGRFEIVDTHELSKSDVFESGVVAVAVANDFSQVVIEHVFTCPPESVAALRANLPAGLDMKLEPTRDPVAIVHVEWTEDGRLMFTAMPLLYGTWGVKGSIGSFSLEPPDGLNLKAGVPIVKGPAFAEMMQHYLAVRGSKPAEPAAGADGTLARNEPELVRVDVGQPGVKVPETGALADLPVATPIPAAGRPPIAMRGNPTPALPVPTPRTTLVMNSTPRPVIPPPSTPGETRPGGRTAAGPDIPPTGPAVAVVPSPGAPDPASIPDAGPPEPPAPKVPRGVIKPFIVSNPGAGGGAWRTYSRGQQPPGRSITPSEASKMADKGGEIPERLYLKGDFVVTASGDNRAVLRAPAGTGEPSMEGVGAARIMVEYPPSAAPPAVGSTLSRDDAEGFEVREVRRGVDGQINIFVREITKGSG